jgi:hypothetical protein
MPQSVWKRVQLQPLKPTLSHQQPVINTKGMSSLHSTLPLVQFPWG